MQLESEPQTHWEFKSQSLKSSSSKKHCGTSDNLFQSGITPLARPAAHVLAGVGAKMQGAAAEAAEGQFMQ